jgi:elongation factor Ts
MNISAADVKALRDLTNAPMMECKAALTEAGGNKDKAAEILRKKLKDIQVKRGERETAEGRIGVFVEAGQQLGAIVEMRCESAPVAKAEHFVKLASDIARQVALQNPASVDALDKQKLFDGSGKSVKERIGDVIGLIRENMRVQRFARLTGLLGDYVHHDGTLGVLVQVEGAKADAQLLRDVCMHIAARNPVAAVKEDVPAAVIDKEKEIAREQIANDPKNKSKPANIIEKILEGKLKTWFAENVLVEQPFVKDDSKTIGQLLAQHGLKMVKFVRYRVGEVS